MNGMEKGGEGGGFGSIQRLRCLFHFFSQVSKTFSTVKPWKLCIERGLLLLLFLCTSGGFSQALGKAGGGGGGGGREAKREEIPRDGSRWIKSIGGVRYGRV